MPALFEKEIETKFAEIAAGYSETTYSYNEQNQVTGMKEMPSKILSSHLSLLTSHGRDYPDQSLKQERESSSTTSPNYNINYTYDGEAQ